MGDHSIGKCPCRRANPACTRRVGLAAFSSRLRGFKLVPLKCGILFFGAALLVIVQLRHVPRVGHAKAMNENSDDRAKKWSLPASRERIEESRGAGLP
jgi:hypothetical protein